jgi:hypothetical protein
MKPIIPQSVLITFVVSLVIGLLIGLPIGWYTVSWEISDNAKTHLVQMVADSFIVTPDPAKAKARLTAFLGNDVAVNNAILVAVSKTGGGDQTRIKQMAAALNIPTTGTPTTAGGNSLLSLLVPALVVIFLIVVVGGALFFLRMRGSSTPAATKKPSYSSSSRMTPMTTMPTMSPTGGAGVASGGASVMDEPVSSFKTTYVLGDDLFDESFSVDDQQGNFLGECGVVISETMGVGDPKKVAAFEVWLFDKNDIRTVTKVLMSEHAFNDENVKARLSNKGEPVQARSGEAFDMDTAALKVQVRVVDMQYGSGALPTNSIFQQLTLEISAWKKPETAAAPAA